MLQTLGQFDLYVENETLLLADVTESFRNKCLEIYELYPAFFFFSICIGVAGVKLELLTDADMLLMVGKDIRGGICHAVQKYGKAQ